MWDSWRRSWLSSMNSILSTYQDKKTWRLIPCSKFVSSEIRKYAKSVYLQVLKTPSINSKLIVPIGVWSWWIDPIKAHLEIGLVPNNAMKAHKLFVRALMYAPIESISSKRHSWLWRKYTREFVTGPWGGGQDSYS